VFADVQEDTGNISPKDLKKKLSSRTKAIIPVHYGGHPCDLEEIRKIAKKRNLFVIEDAAHALGAKYKGSKIGSCRYSDMTILSFHPLKSITTGEGGAVLTNDKRIYERLLLLMSHGITKEKSKFRNKLEGDWFYEMQDLGFNYRMTDFQAALGISQLKKLGKFIARRRQIVGVYERIFRDNPYFELPVEKDYAYSSYHLYHIRLKDSARAGIKRGELFAYLRKKGIGVQVHFIPVYLHPYYQKLGYKKGICKKAELFYQRVMSIPLHQGLTSRDIRFIALNVQKAFQKLS